MAERINRSAPTDTHRVRSWTVRHPVSSFLVLAYAITVALGLSQRDWLSRACFRVKRLHMEFLRTSSGRPCGPS